MVAIRDPHSQSFLTPPKLLGGLLGSCHCCHISWLSLRVLGLFPSLEKTDPFWTASSLSPSDYREAQNQSICSLAELLELAKGNATLLLNLRDPPREHPYRSSFLNVTLEAVLRSGFPQHQVLWLPNKQRTLVRKVAPGFQQTSGLKEAVTSLRRGHIQRLNLRYTQVSSQELRCSPCPRLLQERVGLSLPQFCHHHPQHTHIVGQKDGHTGIGHMWFKDERVSASPSLALWSDVPFSGHGCEVMKRMCFLSPHTGPGATRVRMLTRLSLPHRDYASWNLSVNLYTVNAPWLFSLMWCAGVPSVTSDNSHTLSQVPSPLWIMVSWGQWWSCPWPALTTRQALCLGLTLGGLCSSGESMEGVQA
ncbi:hypothetical protein P7K49_022334 [Saguinus oedipus]|uniref:GP-PDE domain-containing protein n=1 Tax=Saguinus oedipus TaxID=9490 RepID=A0ABQ9UVY6_SAGOE|nr:hypothetical protein P7K49_022334 [Saguinus oedipus]